MYGHIPSMNVTNQISTGEDDNGAGVGAESIDNHHIHYETQALEDGNGGVGGMVDDVNSDTVYVSGSGSEMSLQHDDSSQLTLSFRGQVYVFDSVTPDKVRFSIYHFFELLVYSGFIGLSGWLYIGRKNYCVFSVFFK